MKVAPNFVVSLLTSVFLCPDVRVAAELDEGRDAGGPGIPLRKWRNEAKKLRQRHRRDWQMSNFHDDGDLMMLAEFYANRTLFEERRAEQSVSTGAVPSPYVYDVIIVGAGWSGISAAMTLSSQGITNYIILEAKDHIGGRSYTTQETFEGATIPVDHGSGWLHGGSANPLNDIALQTGNPTSTSTYNQKVYKSNGGGALPDEDLNTIYSENFENGFMDYQEFLQWDRNADEGLDISANEYLETISDNLKKEVLKHLYTSLIELEYSARMSQLSLWWWDNDLWLDGPNQDDYLMIDGYGPLIESYAAPVLDKVVLEKAVTVIDYQNGPTVDVQCGNELYKAKKVIITVPLGVLKAELIEIIPNLTGNLRAIIGRLGMGKMNKIIMFWPQNEVFWPQETEILGDVEERDSDFSFFNHMPYNGDRPFLDAFFAGEEAELLETQYASSNPALYEEEITELAMIPLRNMFGNNIPSPSKVVVTKWNVDNYSMGAYSFNAVGTNEDDRTKLGTPIRNSKIVIAGEATSEYYFQTTHGAYWEGKRAAESVADSLL